MSGTDATALKLDEDAMTVLVEVLTYHYRKNSSDCGCGWAVLGASHPVHVAQVFRDSLVAKVMM